MLEFGDVPLVYMLGERRVHDRKKAVHPGKYDLCELFSQARVAKEACAQGLRGGWSLDIDHVDEITGSRWDLSQSAAQEKVMKMLRRDKPLCVGLSPECTLFSALQNLRKTEIDKAELERAVECVRFCVRVADYQRSKGRFSTFNIRLLPGPGNRWRSFGNSRAGMTWRR